MKLYISVIFLCISTFVEAQDYFSRLYIQDSISAVGKEIKYFNDHIYVQIGRRCDDFTKNCSEILKLDMSGNLKWNTVVDKIAPGNQNSMLFLHDKIFITGHRNSGDQSTGLYHCELDTFGGILKNVLHQLPKITNLNYGSIVSEDKLILYGATDGNDLEPEIDVDGLIITYNFDSMESYVDSFDYGLPFVDVFDMKSLGNNEFVFFSRRKQDDYFIELDWVVEKMNEEGERFDLYNEKIDNPTSFVLSNLEVLANGNIVFAYPSVNSSKLEAIFRFINSEGEFLYDVELFQDYFPSYPTIFDISSTRSGGLIGCGFFTDKSSSNIERNAYLFKITAEGDIAWDRKFKFQDSTGIVRPSRFASIEELENGDIIVTGSADIMNAENDLKNLWVLKLNQEGCVLDDCGYTLTNVNNSETKPYLNIFPNPSSNFINIETELEINMITIYSAIGSICYEGNESFVDISSFDAGVYFARIQYKENNYTIHKIVKY